MSLVNLAHLCLGTASWGEPYNGRTPPSDDELARILDVAAAGGIRWLDTAAAYGNAESRLLEHEAWRRFKIVTKVRSWIEATVPVPAWDVRSRLEPYAAAWLYHLEPCEQIPDYVGPRERGRMGQGWGTSVYTVAQAETTLDFVGVQAIQVPWHYPINEDVGWEAVRDRAYADGVLFFGRQPFARRSDLSEGQREFLFRCALLSNPRGWCVVGVETVAQLEELLAWRDAL